MGWRVPGYLIRSRLPRCAARALVGPSNRGLGAPRAERLFGFRYRTSLVPDARQRVCRNT